MKRIESKYTLPFGLALAGVSFVLAPACGGDKDSSLTDQGGSGGSSTTGKGGSGIQLGDGGNGVLPDPSGGDSSGLGEGGGCGSTRIVAAPPIVNVLLVVDKSLSMEKTLPGVSDTRWEALRNALASTLEQTESKISYGLDLFPYSGKSGAPLPNNDDCYMPAPTAPLVVPVQEGTKATPLILAALDKNPPSGQTPTALALMRAHAYFNTGAGKALTGDKYVLLATDGGPNCSPEPDVSCEAATCTANLDGLCPNENCCDPANGDVKGPTSCLDQDGSVAAVTSLLADAGVKTIVLGIAGTEAYVDTLNALAAESGVTNPDAPPGYFAVSADSGVSGLADALGHITTGLVKSCELHLDEEPPDRDHLFVVVDGVALVEDDADGWTIPDPDLTPPVIQITGATCDKLETEGAEYINVTYGCPQYDPPVK